MPGESRRVQQGWMTFPGPLMLEWRGPRALWFTLGLMGCVPVNRVPPVACSAARPCGPAANPAPAGRGLAELHLHQFANLAFGGGWVWGNADGPADQALGTCSGHGFDHGFAAGMEGGTLNLRRHDPDGYPSFEGWPRWNSVSHHQSHADWLQQAHSQGLDLMVMSAVEQTEFCELLPASTRVFPCDDFSSVVRQLEAAHAFDAAHDWYTIVRSPAEARAAIAAGDMAVVLAVEAGDVFGRGDYRPRLDQLKALGVVALQPVHETDNRFSSAAWHDPPLLVLQALYYRSHPAQWARQRKAMRANRGPGLGHRDIGDTVSRLFGFDLDPQGFNRRGLSGQGEALVKDLMDRSMLVDVAHLSERAIEHSFQLAAARNFYPLFNSHIHLADVEPKEVGEWSYTITPVQRLNQTGGVAGLRSTATVSPTYADSGVRNDCDGSVKSFAQRLAWVTRELKMEVGFASDFGGLASNLAPRFGPDACAKADSNRRDQQQAQVGASGLQLDERGWGHIGQIGEVMVELRQVGADPSALNQGAEVFIRMWERVEDPNRAEVIRPIDVAAAKAALR